MWIILFIVIIIILLALMIQSGKTEANELYPISPEREIYYIITNYKNYVSQASLMFNIPAKRIYSIIYVESRGNPFAKGSSGEIGLMQITEGALKDTNKAYHLNYTMNDLYNSKNNIVLGTAYLSLLKEWLNGDLDKATQAYNVGYSNVKKNSLSGTKYLEKIKNAEKYF